MRKIILILGLMVLAFGMEAQTKIDSVVLSPERTYYEFTGSSTDTMGTGTKSLYAVVDINKTTSVLYNIEVDINSTSAITGTYEKDIVLQGRTHVNDSWSDIEEKADEDGTSDITVDFQDATIPDTSAVATTDPAFYRQFRILIRDGSDVSGLNDGEYITVDYIHWKFYER
ncbi:MAG: hypothetical protein R6U65_00975 [Perlabentimonas sp.]